MRLAAGLLGALLAGPASAQIRSVTLAPPARDFGILVGDLLTASALIELAPGTALDARTLPSPGPAGPLLDVRGVALSSGRGWVRVAVTYQSFVSPEQVMRADAPGYALDFTAHGARLTARVPGFGFSVSPFRHDLQPVTDPAVLRPDHPVAMPDPAGARHRLWAACAAALLAACALAAARPRAAARPFAAAARRIGRQPAPQDLLTLHRAFDATAGRRVFAEDLDAFLVRHPHFSALRAEIEAFFAASRIAFFAATGAPAPPLAGLSRALARAERRA